MLGPVPTLTRQPPPPGCNNSRTIGQASCEATFSHRPTLAAQVACPDGTTNTAGDDASGENTTCYVDVSFDGGAYEICDGTIARVTWNGYHNICEKNKITYDNPPPGVACDNTIVGFHNYGTIIHLDNISAVTGQTRYFICSQHHGSKFKINLSDIIQTNVSKSHACCPTVLTMLLEMMVAIQR